MCRSLSSSRATTPSLRLDKIKDSFTPSSGTLSACSIGLTDPFLKNTLIKVRRAVAVLDFDQAFFEKSLFRI